MRKARSIFTQNFFGCAGFQIIENTEQNSINEACKLAQISSAEIIVICSSDDEYEHLVPDICKILQSNDRSLIVAGYPKKKLADYTELGIDEFIHTKSNIIEVLKKYQNKHLITS